MAAKRIYPNEEIKQQVLERCKTDLYFLCRVVLGYNKLEPVPHQALCDFIEQDCPRKILIGARGIFKTTIGTIARAIQLMLCDPEVRILVVCNTIDNAIMMVNSIKAHWDHNQRLRQLVPEFIPPKRNLVPWSGKALQLMRQSHWGEPTVMAAGVDKQMAGTHFNWILGDDVVAASRDDLKEGGIIIIKAEEVDKAVGWFKLTMQGLSINDADPARQTKVQFIVNRWAVRDFADYVLCHHTHEYQGPETRFETKIMSVHNPDGSLLWPTVLTEGKLRQKLNEQGQFMYWTQYECLPYDPKSRGFPVGNLERYGMFYEGETPPGFERMRLYALMDLADKNKPESCCTSLVLAAIDANNHIWVVEAEKGKLDPTAKFDLIAKMWQRYHFPVLYMEKNLHEETMKFTLKKELAARGVQLRVEVMPSKGRNKNARIMRLQPWYECGAMHFRRDMKDLLREMSHWPFDNEVDCIDALAYIFDVGIRGPAIATHAIHAGREWNHHTISVQSVLDDIRRQNRSYGSGPFSLQPSRRRAV